MTVIIEVRPLAEQTWQLLQTITNVNHFDGETAIPAYDAGDATTHRFWDLGASGRPENVHAYEVFYAGAGRRFPTRLNAVPGALAWSFQVTCVGGDRNRCLWCADRVVARLTGVRLDLGDGRTSGKIREPGDVGPIRRDPDIQPARYYLPLLFGVHVAG